MAAICSKYYYEYNRNGYWNAWHGTVPTVTTTTHTKWVDDDWEHCRVESTKYDDYDLEKILNKIKVFEKKRKNVLSILSFNSIVNDKCFQEIKNSNKRLINMPLEKKLLPKLGLFKRFGFDIYKE